MRNRTLDREANRTELLDRFARLGIGADRVTLEPGAIHLEFLRSYDRIDIALDCFPYNGGTTTAEALWQGVPVLTCNGDRWAGRTSRSILLAAGLEAFVATDIEAFVGTAVQMARAPATPTRLAALRQGLRARLRNSAACGTVDVCRALERLYVGVPTG